MERKERKSPASDTLYEVLSLESEAERERRKTTASPGALSTGPGGSGASPPEDEEEEGETQLWNVRGLERESRGEEGKLNGTRLGHLAQGCLQLSCTQLQVLNLLCQLRTITYHFAVSPVFHRML